MNYRYDRYDRYYAYTKRKGGYVALEAAMLLPVFIIGMAMLCFVIRYGIIYEQIYGAMADETEKTMIEMYGTRICVDAPSRIRVRGSENVSRLEEIEANVPVPYVGFNSADHVYKQSVKYIVTLPFQETFNRSFETSQILVFRPFVGKDNSKASFDNPEEEKTYVEVWVFPRAGEKYHIASCRFISGYAKQRILTSDLKLRYGPCKLCGAAKMQKGAVVYCFTGSGKKYHRADCSLVDKYIISMDKIDAEEKGYSACKICGGGN